jgi:ribosomal protein L29
MNTKEIKKLSQKELEKALAEERANVRQFRFAITGSKQKDIKAGANARKTVARILTEMKTRTNA